MELSGNSGTAVLKKQLGLKEYSCRFLVYEGHYKFIITSLKSKLRFNHMPTGERQQEHEYRRRCWREILPVPLFICPRLFKNSWHKIKIMHV